MNNYIKCKALTGLPLTEQERAKFLLYIATLEQAIYFLKTEKIKNGN